jgi:16S rRNA (guanine966-N2)-methyltransferase
MTRVIAGRYGGRRLQVPPGAGTRPTSDRAREGLFSTLLSLVDLEGARVLDLYAGSGALGLEALSRGAAEATLVERDPRALTAVRANVAALGAAALVVEADAAAFLARGGPPYRLVLLDPPYDVDVAPVLEALEPWVEAGGVVVVERASRGAAPTAPDWLVQDRSRRYGEATLWYFRRP